MDSNLYPLLMPHKWTREDTIVFPLFESSQVVEAPETPVVVPCFVTEDAHGLGLEFPKLSELLQFKVNPSILGVRAVNNLTKKLPKPTFVVVTIVHTYKILSLVNMGSFVAEYIMDENLLHEAQQQLQATCIAVGIPRKNTLFCCTMEDALNIKDPPFQAFINVVFEQGEPIAGGPLTTTVYIFKDGKCSGFLSKPQEGTTETTGATGTTESTRTTGNTGTTESTGNTGTTESTRTTGNTGTTVSSAPKNCCASCGSEGKLLVCQGCKKIAYCGKNCQILHWPQHKGHCHKK